MEMPPAILTIEIVEQDGVFFASATSGPPWGISHSTKSVPDLLRNTAKCLEMVHEAGPGQFPELFAGRDAR